MSPGRGTVFLLHGLWVSDVVMRPLGHRLARHGWQIRYHNYRSRRDTLASAAEHLAALVRVTPGPVHLLGHSLGGIVVNRALRLLPEPFPGRVVVLGTPANGSALARSLARSTVGRAILGPIGLEGLTRYRCDWPPGLPLLVVAGTLPIGFGLLAGLARPHDGTVTVAETMVAGTANLCAQASHMGLLLSSQVAMAASSFLLAGRAP